MSNSQSIPVVDLRDFREGTGEQRAAFVETVGSALQDLGFFAVEGHGVEETTIRDAYQLTEEFFDLPIVSKLAYEKSGLKGERGYTSFGREHAKDYSAPDLKEFWHVGRELEANHPLAKVYPENIWPNQVPRFKPVMLELYKQLGRCAHSLLEACAVYLDEPRDSFAGMAEGGNSILRLIHYPPVPDDRDPASVRAAAHEDINFITLLCEATAAGLELLQRDGTWRPISALKGQIIVDSGDMLQNLTNGLLRSTTHRVVNPDNSRERRFSMPFFVHPRGEVSLNPLPSCVARQNGAKLYPDISARAFLEKRLREIGFY